MRIKIALAARHDFAFFTRLQIQDTREKLAKWLKGERWGRA